MQPRPTGHGGTTWSSLLWEYSGSVSNLALQRLLSVSFYFGYIKYCHDVLLLFLNFPCFLEWRWSIAVCTCQVVGLITRTVEPNGNILAPAEIQKKRNFGERLKDPMLPPFSLFTSYDSMFLSFSFSGYCFSFQHPDTIELHVHQIKCSSVWVLDINLLLLDKGIVHTPSFNICVFKLSSFPYVNGISGSVMIG